MIRPVYMALAWAVVAWPLGVGVFLPGAWPYGRQCV